MRKFFHIAGVVIVVAALAVLVNSRNGGVRPYVTPGAPDMFGQNELGMVSSRSMAFNKLAAPSMAPLAEYAPQADQSAGGDANAPKDRLIIRTGSMSLVVKDVPLVMDEVRVYVEGQSGFLVSGSLNSASANPTASMTVRIPVEKYGQTYEWVKGKAVKIASETSSGQDVTEEYVDLESQLRNLRASEQQFLEIMKRSGKISEVLEVQRELERVRGEIERVLGRQKYLSQSAHLATLTVYMSTEESQLPIVDPQKRWEPLAVMKAALRSLKDVGQNAANAIIWIVVFAVVWIPVLIVVFWWRRRHQSVGNQG
ncbi:DUF4349 domain-containing protein [Candidatus Uhrbacteria bacterium]|nr:DUF4349 domain-containing protein [Candidatus Uhrbacteria bacterium]